MIEVRVANFPGTVHSVVLADGATAADAFAAAELTPTGNETTVNGVVAAMSTVLNDGDRVISATSAKGN